MGDNMSRGGARPGSGRKPGSPTARKALEAINAVSEAYPGWTPLLYFAHVANDEQQPIEVRLDAAKAAARYMIPVPKSVEADPEAIIHLEERLVRIRSEARVDRPYELHGLAERLERASMLLNASESTPRALAKSIIAINRELD